MSYRGEHYYHISPKRQMSDQEWLKSRSISSRVGIRIEWWQQRMLPFRDFQSRQRGAFWQFGLKYITVWPSQTSLKTWWPYSHYKGHKLFKMQREPGLGLRARPLWGAAVLESKDCDKNVKDHEHFQHVPHNNTLAIDFGVQMKKTL